MADYSRALVAAFALIGATDPAYADAPCGSCHVDGKPSAPHAKLWPSHPGVTCLDCHHGDGKATDPALAHPKTGPDELLAGVKTQAACVRCHVAGIAGTEQVVRGGEIYLSQGCQLCHLGVYKLGNLAAFAPPLMTIGGRGSGYLVQMLHDPKVAFKDTVMPSYALTLKESPDKETALVTYLMSLRADLPAPARPAKSGARCASCHADKKPIATELSAHKCRLLLDDKESFTCARCHKSVPVSERECLYILQRRNQCGVCHEGGVDG